MKLAVVKGLTSKLLHVFIADAGVTTGAGLTGLVYNSAGLTAYYYREGAASATSITLATMTVGTWASGGFKEIDATNMPGLYQIGVPDAALASGANSVAVLLKGAANMVPVVLEIELVAVDWQTTIPAAVWNATMSGYLTAGSTGESLNAAGSAGDPWATALPGAYGSGSAGKIVGDNLNATVSSVKAKTDNLPASPAAVGDIPSAATIAAAVWAYVVEGSYTALGFVRVMMSALAGKCAGAATTTVTFRDTGDSKNRIEATVDAYGNRSSVTLDAS